MILKNIVRENDTQNMQKMRHFKNLFIFFICNRTRDSIQFTDDIHGVGNNFNMSKLNADHH